MSNASASDLGLQEGQGGVPNREDIAAWLVDYLVRLLKLELKDVRAEATFDSFGLDSAATVGLTGDLSDWLKIEVGPSVVYGHPNISALSEYLESEVRNRAQR